MSISKNARPEKLSALTSLRFVAAMMVVFMHTSSAFGWEFIPRSFVFGFGVSFFFILSGFILTHNYSQKRVTFSHFLRRRWARLWPAHLLWLVALMVLLPSGWWTFEGAGVLSKWATLSANILMLHSAVPVQEYYFSWNAVSWSISTELFLYVSLYPLLNNLQNTWRCKLIVTCVLFCVLRALYFWNIFDGTNVAFAFPFARLFEFCLGICAYLLWDKLRDRDISVRFLAAAVSLMYAAWLSLNCFFIPEPNMMERYLIVQCLSNILGYGACACVIIAVAHNNSVASRLLGVRFFVYLGEVSYSMYLCHQVFIRMFMSREESWAKLSQIEQALVYFPLIFVASMLSYHIVEIPGRNIIRGFAIREAISRVGMKRPANS